MQNVAIVTTKHSPAIIHVGIEKELCLFVGDQRKLAMIAIPFENLVLLPIPPHPSSLQNDPQDQNLRGRARVAPEADCFLLAEVGEDMSCHFKPLVRGNLGKIDILT
jgi:hypothetical protein